MQDPKSKDDSDKEDWPRWKPRPRDWESAVEKQIREAMERGDFDNLPGQGKPLDLHRDPNTPPEWETAFKLLKDAGFAPAWIELDKELRIARAQLFAPFDNYIKRLSDKGKLAASERFEHQLISEFREKGQELNRQIDLFNLKSPSPHLHHVRIRIDDEIEKFRRAIGNWKND